MNIDDTVDIESRYARWLQIAVLIGFIALLGGFVLYLSGLLPNRIDPAAIPGMWHMEAEEFITYNGLESGWSMLLPFKYGDVVALATLFLLGLTTFTCFIPSLLVFIKHRNTAYSVFVILQIAVFIVAISGIIA